MDAAKSKEDYLELRSRYMPGRLRLVIIAESPPASGKYIYDPSGERTEPLFSALMRFLRYDAGDKASGLEELRRRGILLVDATYEPVNQQSDKERSAKIEAKYPDLLSDLRNLIGQEAIPVVLIKANVCRLLEDRLIADGMRIINKGRSVYFPGSGRQKQFQQQLQDILALERLLI
jgi:hypothetical protein